MISSRFFSIWHDTCIFGSIRKRLDVGVDRATAPELHGIAWNRFLRVSRTWTSRRRSVRFRSTYECTRDPAVIRLVCAVKPCTCFRTGTTFRATRLSPRGVYTGGPAGLFSGEEENAPGAPQNRPPDTSPADVYAVRPVPTNTHHGTSHTWCIHTLVSCTK